MTLDNCKDSSVLFHFKSGFGKRLHDVKMHMKTQSNTNDEDERELYYSLALLRDCLLAWTDWANCWKEIKKSCIYKQIDYLDAERQSLTAGFMGLQAFVLTLPNSWHNRITLPDPEALLNITSDENRAADKWKDLAINSPEKCSPYKPLPLAKEENSNRRQHISTDTNYGSKSRSIEQLKSELSKLCEQSKSHLTLWQRIDSKSQSIERQVDHLKPIMEKQMELENENIHLKSRLVTQKRECEEQLQASLEIISEIEQDFKNQLQSVMHENRSLKDALQLPIPKPLPL
eukprot:NODE_5556_length_998_cov_25.314286_g4982_i0.p1 GENE.NODE_5556_length_998_cov_25.314286_g4982_i0~~NODE_5556_length_998_cov_25.314286_g4982_i0.p1  ORF type:complete len:306 (+),score=41.79 NODE_5556_length_998_cov_25.314286_g4982_i0:55-918(+)